MIARMRSAYTIAAAFVVLGKRAMNSSPPYRATTESRRDWLARSCTTCLSTSSGAVAPAVVDGLEAVEVEQDQRERLLIAGRAAHLFVEPEHQVAPIVAVGERILERELFEPGAANRDRRVGGERPGHVFETRMK